MIKVFEGFAGIGTQRMALKNLGVEHEVIGISEIDKYAIDSYNAIHGTEFEPQDITQISGQDLQINNTSEYIYTNLLFPLSRFISCRKYGWNGKRQRYKVGATLGS